MKLSYALLMSAAVVMFGQMVSARAQEQRRIRPQTALISDNLQAVCVLSPVGGSGVSGTIVFEQQGTRLHVSGKITGLTPGKHAFHVHEFGDLRGVKDGMSAGGHFNPHHMPHGAPDAQSRHVGDLGNIDANDQGTATIDMNDSVIKLIGPNSIIGRSIIVHAKADEFTQPVGNAGGRVAFGVIGWAKPPMAK